MRRLHFGVNSKRSQPENESHKKICHVVQRRHDFCHAVCCFFVTKKPKTVIALPIMYKIMRKN